MRGEKKSYLLNDLYMKKFFILLSVLFFCNYLSAQNTGKAIDHLSFKSNILGKEVKYSVYLPAGYSESEMSYPVLYLLHGYSDDHTGWLQFGQANVIADRCIADGSAPAMIIIMPDAEVTWYINNASGKTRYEDMFFEELIPCMEKNYRIRPKKEFRAIAGLSMGGYGSLLYALKHPDTFAACCPLSAAVYTDQNLLNMPEDRYKGFYAPFDGKKDTRLTSHWYQNSPLELIAKMPDNQKKSVRFYIDCGDDDFLYEGNAALHVALRKQNIPHEFRVRDGGHTWEYWRSALPEVLKFVGTSFRR